MVRPTDPLARRCRVLGLPHRTRSCRAPPRDDRAVRQASAAVAPPSPTSGRRRMAAQVGRAPSRRRVTRQRAPRVRRHRGPWRRPRPRQPRPPHRRPGVRRVPHVVAHRAAREPAEIGVREITDGRLGAECIDRALSRAGLTRDMRGWPLGRTRGQALTLTARQRALAPRTPRMHHRAQGLHYAAPQSIQTVPAAGVQIRMAAGGAPRQHGDAERVIRTSKAAESHLTADRACPEALAQIGQCMDDVDRPQRLPSALG
jgi:hypothetical protein